MSFKSEIRNPKSEAEWRLTAETRMTRRADANAVTDLAGIGSFRAIAAFVNLCVHRVSAVSASLGIWRVYES